MKQTLKTLYNIYEENRYNKNNYKHSIKYNKNSRCIITYHKSVTIAPY